MVISKNKKLEYIRQILQSIVTGALDDKEDSVLIEVALSFIDDIKGEGDKKN